MSAPMVIGEVFSVVNSPFGRQALSTGLSVLLPHLPKLFDSVCNVATEVARLNELKQQSVKESMSNVSNVFSQALTSNHQIAEGSSSDEVRIALIKETSNILSNYSSTIESLSDGNKSGRVINISLFGGN